MSDEKKSTTGGGQKVAAAAAAPAREPGVVIHRLDEAQFQRLQRTLLVAGMVAGKSMRADVPTTPATLQKMNHAAGVLLAELLS